MNNAQPDWIKSLRSMRFMQLLFFSLGTLLVQAMFPRSPLLNVVISLLYLNAMLVALSASGTRPLFRQCLAGLWLLSLVTRFAAVSGLEQSLFVISKGIGCILLTVCIGSMAHYMFFRHRVTTDTLFAGIVIYVLIAILFGQLYSVTDTLLPGSFAYPTELAAANSHLPDIGWNYFSFVTIATLGYGDIVPRHPLAQMLAAIESVVGQFYVAIVVARLVSLYAAAQRHPS